MRDGLPSRGRASKFGSDLPATQWQFHVVCSRIVSADELVVAVQGPFVGTFEDVQHHAEVVAQGVHARFGGTAICDVLLDNDLLLDVQVGGAA